jgi:molecular chaperone GrpE (heat shock protein)
MLAEFRALNARVGRLENAITAATEKLSAASAPSPQMSAGFQKLDAQLAGLRESESVNHRLFDSLHDELIRYRDNFLHESLQKPFIRDLVILFDDLSGIASQLSTSGEMSATVPSQSRHNLDNALHALVEILHRLEVTEIEQKEHVDRALHKVVSYEPAEFQEDDGRIIMRVKRGFLWRDKVLRPEEVVAKRFE